VTRNNEDLNFAAKRRHGCTQVERWPVIFVDLSEKGHGGISHDGCQSRGFDATLIEKHSPVLQPRTGRPDKAWRRHRQPDIQGIAAGPVFRITGNIRRIGEDLPDIIDTQRLAPRTVDGALTPAAWVWFRNRGSGTDPAFICDRHVIEKPVFSRAGAQFAAGLLIDRQTIRNADLPLVVETLQLEGFLPGLAQCGQKQRGQDRDDGDHDEQLDQGETREWMASKAFASQNIAFSLSGSGGVQRP